MNLVLAIVYLSYEQELCSEDKEVREYNFPLAQVFQRVDSNVHWIQRHPLRIAIGFDRKYAMDSDFFPWVALNHWIKGYPCDNSVDFQWKASNE